MGRHVTEVVPASAFGLLPSPLGEPPSPSADRQQRLAGEKFRNTPSGRHETALTSTTGSYSEGVEEDRKEEDKGKLVGGGGREIPTAMLPLLLEKVLHLFRHGTPSGLELELSRVGGEALRALTTPDVRSTSRRC